jgi:hypothetical protein
VVGLQIECDEGRGNRMRHTPGPWKIFTGYGSVPSKPIVIDCIPDVDGKCIANAICYLATSNNDAVANANLIAAAPDLLDALRELHDFACPLVASRNHERSCEAFNRAAELLGRLE